VCVTRIITVFAMPPKPHSAALKSATKKNDKRADNLGMLAWGNAAPPSPPTGLDPEAAVSPTSRDPMETAVVQIVPYRTASQSSLRPAWLPSVMEFRRALPEDSTMWLTAAEQLLVMSFGLPVAAAQEQDMEPVRIVPLTCMRGTCYQCQWIPQLDTDESDNGPFARARLWEMCSACTAELVVALNCASPAEGIHATQQSRDRLSAVAAGMIKAKLAGEPGSVLWAAWQCGDARSWPVGSLGRFIANRFDPLLPGGGMANCITSYYI
jgi:hypothetical protein